MPHKFARALLLADVIAFPERKLGDHSSRLDDGDATTEQKHGIADPNDYIKEFSNKGVVRDKYPNFYQMGFKSQAFIDITISKDGLDQPTSDSKMEDQVRAALRDVDNVVLIYTVFGQVDLRCKVVGVDLRDVERTAMEIRDIPGVLTSTTSVVLDETSYDGASQKWGDLVRKNAERLDHLLPRPPNRKRVIKVENQ